MEYLKLKKYFFKWAIPGSFFFVPVFSMQLTVKNGLYKSLPMTGFEQRTSDITSDLSDQLSHNHCPTDLLPT